MTKKILEKQYLSFEEVTDLSGVRVVCLFRSDLQKIRDIIEAEFEVIEIDTKSFDDPDAFGYMSIHFDCRLNQKFSGPRYDAIKNRRFELQLRTIGMHAWAAVSHYLDYKGEWDVPQHLKKDLNALSAIFYVADTQFENVYRSKLTSAKKVKHDASTDDLHDHLINFDTLSAYINKRFKGRERASSAAVSEMVQELGQVGYTKIGEVAKAVDASDHYVQAFESGEDYELGEVGALRVALGFASPRYRDEVYRRWPSVRSKILEYLNK